MEDQVGEGLQVVFCVEDCFGEGEEEGGGAEEDVDDVDAVGGAFWFVVIGFSSWGKERALDGGGVRKGKEGEGAAAYGVSGGEAAMVKTSQPHMAAVRRVWKAQRGIRRCFRHGERRSGAIGVFDEGGGREE